MNHTIHSLPAVKLEKLSLLSAHMNNSILTRLQPWKTNILDREVYLEAIFPIGDFHAAYMVIIHCGESDWIIEFGQVPPLSLHPLFVDKPEVLYIPEDVKLAVLEILITPLLKQFEAFIGVPVEIVGTSFGYSYNQEVSVSCYIPLLLYLEGKQTSIPIRLGIKKRNDALMLLEKFRSLPSNYRDISYLPIAIGFEAGYTNLTMNQLCGLQKDDFLLPDKYFIHDGKVQLRFAGFLVDCKFHGGVATVMEVTNTDIPSSEGGGAPNGQQPNETQSSQAMKPDQQGGTVQTQQNSRQAAGQPSGAAKNSSVQATTKIDIEGLELPVVFELERRYMTVHDIGALAPGYTFALSVDIQSPVTLRVNGRAIGIGRLVELNGTLGVQIVQLMDVSTT